jgi:FkbM family methyltransferase
MVSDFEFGPMSRASALDISASIVCNSPPSIDFLQHLNFEQLRYSSDLLLKIKERGGICLYGAGNLGRQALHAARRYRLPVKKIVDQRADTVSFSLDGLRVSAPSSVCVGDVVVVCVGSGVSQIVERLQLVGANMVGLDRYFHMLGCDQHPARQYIPDLVTDLPRYTRLVSRLSWDAESIDTLIAVIAGRLALDESLLYPVSRKGVPQWFDSCFFEKNPRHNMVDGGAFDGDTISSFIRENGNEFVSITGFEPDKALALLAKAKHSNDSRVRIVPAGLSDRHGNAQFSQTNLTNGTFNFEASDTAGYGECVSVTTIDASVSSPVTYLKLDVEGNEERALLGARRCLMVDRPKVAVAVYHRAADIHRIPGLLSELTEGYRFLLRHYTETSFETVLYAAPFNGVSSTDE